MFPDKSVLTGSDLAFDKSDRDAEPCGISMPWHKPNGNKSALMRYD